MLHARVVKSSATTLSERGREAIKPVDRTFFPKKRLKPYISSLPQFLWFLLCFASFFLYSDISVMISAAQNLSQEWDSTHHHRRRHLQHRYYTNHQQKNRQLQNHDHDHVFKESDQLDLDQDEKEEAPIYDQAVMARRKRSLSGKVDVGISGEGRMIQKVCADCKTSKTPLWRSGPAGPKSLCNACGIRYRKRRRADILGGGNVGMKEKQRKENVLFLLQRKFPGREDAEAAVLLMALSCGLFVHT